MIYKSMSEKKLTREEVVKNYIYTMEWVRNRTFIQLSKKEDLT
jgi:hypothetical protein